MSLWLADLVFTNLIPQIDAHDVFVASVVVVPPLIDECSILSQARLLRAPHSFCGHELDVLANKMYSIYICSVLTSDRFFSPSRAYPVTAARFLSHVVLRICGSRIGKAEQGARCQNTLHLYRTLRRLRSIPDYWKEA